MTDVLDETARRALRRKVRAATLQALRALGSEATRSDIVGRALAHGQFTADELAAPAPKCARSDRLIDHLLRWELTNLRRDGLVENPRRGVWRLADAAVEAEPVALAEPVSQDRRAQLKAMPYREYLRTPEWRRTRAAALLRAGNRCALDARHTGTLHVHHNSYDAPRGAEGSIDLVVLCENCHHQHHAAHGRPGPRRAAPSTDDVAPAPPRAASVPPPGWRDATAPPTPPDGPKRDRGSLLRRILRAS